MATRHESQELYDGPAHVLVDAQRLEVGVRLRGRFEPIDGLFHWWGRIDASADLDGVTRSGATISLETPYGTASGRLSDVDPWGRYRIAGTGRPPF